MKKVLLYGLGRSNLALYRLMILDDALELYISCEDMNFPDEIDVKHIVEIDNLDFSQYDEVYIPPGISEKHKIYSYCEPKNEIDYAFTKLNAKFIGITGSNGKSTTCKLLNDALNYLGYSCYIGGNYGIPLSEIALSKSDSSYIVLELSSFQLRVLERIQFEAVIITNIEPNHLDWHVDMDSYKNSKLSILQMLTEDGLAIISDRSVCDSMRIPHKFSEDITLSFEPRNLDKASQWQNVYGVLEHLNIDTNSLNEFDFVSLEHRLQHLRSKSGILCINDSKSTTPGSTLFALENIQEENLVLILGGKSKGLDLRDFVQSLADYLYKIDSIFIYGDLLKDLDLFKDLGVNIYSNLGFMKLLDKLKQELSPFQTIVLSPAFSSLDQFSSFEERGQVFIEFTQTI
ncbi:MAG: hypothetical protein KC646_09270 [Candidatus Cloacimonetes bacterium]|nr:hypothetical protein [Candidatus Cloacimonadota bacterium]